MSPIGNSRCRIEHILISPGHNYVGHFGGPPGEHPLKSIDTAKLLAGHGIEGDRYAMRDNGHRKQITFFDMKVIEDLAAHFGHPVAPGSVRRNVFIRGVDLPGLVGKRFRIGEVRFEGVDDCKPCKWMDDAIGPGAESFLRGKSGLRAMILDDGELQLGDARFDLEGVGDDD